MNPLQVLWLLWLNPMLKPLQFLVQLAVLVKHHLIRWTTFVKLYDLLLKVVVLNPMNKLTRRRLLPNLMQLRMVHRKQVHNMVHSNVVHNKWWYNRVVPI